MATRSAQTVPRHALRARAADPKILRTCATWLGLLGLLAIAWLGGAWPSEARIDPYYVLRDPTAAKLRPRVLVVFDTSQTMAWVLRDTDGDGVNDAPDDCAWNECETADAADESRIALARRGIREMVAKTAGQVSWSVMTFDQLTAPTSVPPQCFGRRFQWVNDSRTAEDDIYGNFGYTPIPAYAEDGVTGKWRLCSGDVVRPYPYLRWDELGVEPKITEDDQSGAVPASPLISVENGDINSESNATRRVQWFPRFMGIRTQLNEATDPDQELLARTVGDYGATTSDRIANVWEQDFYYWPYVDGFPGYAAHTFRPGSEGNPLGGVASEDPALEYATLYAPFYLTFEEADISRDRWGPPSLQVSTETVLERVSPLIEGGIDASSDAIPWRTVIGTLPANVDDLPDWTSRYNTIRSHRSVASYLHFVKTMPVDAACTPLSLVLLTGERPTFANDEGGVPLHENLAALRKELGVNVYVIGMRLPTDIPDAMVSPPSSHPDPRAINAMACAGAGACDGSCSTPCEDTPADGWDTCANADDRMNAEDGCAFRASTIEELRSSLDRIVSTTLALEIDSGPASDVRDIMEASDDTDDDIAVQTRVVGYTEFPGWRGHVTRSYCDLVDADGDLLPSCEVPSPEFPQTQQTFGPCPHSRDWDAGECLRQTAWRDRRLYTHNAEGELVPLANGTQASEGFVDELTALGIVEGSDAGEQATALMRFIHGADWPGDWKLPGLAKSAPLVVRRIPPYVPQQFPTVAIRDPHCAGRSLDITDDQTLPQSLEDFAEAAYDTGVATEEAQEAVIIGDDLGVLHAFQYDSGNELWGFIPRFMLANADAQRRNGVANVGQPIDGGPHRFGIGGTANVAFAFDPRDADDPDDGIWRQLLVVGLAAGESERRQGDTIVRGGEYFALDVSHMNPNSTRGPFEVLWTTEDDALRDDYEPLLGQTWARPAISYRVPSNQANQEPQALVVLGSGYAVDPAHPLQGRNLILADAVTGVIERFAELPTVNDADASELAPVDPEYGALVDPAIVSHCSSGVWAEIQEVYVPDPAGRLFRWDLGEGLSDSGAVWSGTAPGPYTALPLTAQPFRSCQSLHATCEVDSGNKADPFVFGAAVTANDRIEDTFDTAFEDPVVREDEEILIAMISGTPNDPRNFDFDRTEGLVHSSLYLMADNHHRPGSEHRGLSPQADTDQPKLRFGDASQPFSESNRGEFGNYTDWLRVAVSDVPRVRSFVPYPGAARIEESGRFGARTRPIRAPQIRVQALATALDDDAALQPISGIEQYLVSYFVYEPAREACDARFYDPSAERWYPDQGESYELIFAVLGTSNGGFDFGFAADQPDYYGYNVEGKDFVRLVAVNQLGGDDCVGGCGSQGQAPPKAGCVEPLPAAPPTGQGGFSLALTTKTIESFTPVE